jgi:hypothetical protein
METNKSNNYLLVFLMASFFFTNRIIGELLLTKVGRGSVLILIIANFLVPVIYLLLKPLFEKLRIHKLNHMTIEEKSTPFYLIIKFVLSVYLLITLVITIYFSTNLLTTYYYSSLPLIIYFISLVLLVGYALTFNRKVSLLLPTLLLFAMIIFYAIYLTNTTETRIFNLNKLRIDVDNIVLTIILVLPILFEPFMFLLWCDGAQTPYKKRYIFLFTLIAALLCNYSLLRQTWEFGSLLPYLHSPFFESLKYMRVGDYSENGDLFVILYWLGATFIRIILTCNLFTKAWNLKGPLIASILLFFACSVAWLFLQNINVFADVMNSLIIISVFTLVGYSILIFIFSIIGGNKNVKLS